MGCEITRAYNLYSVNIVTDIQSPLLSHVQAALGKLKGGLYLAGIGVGCTRPELVWAALGQGARIGANSTEPEWVQAALTQNGCKQHRGHNWCGEHWARISAEENQARIGAGSTGVVIGVGQHQARIGAREHQVGAPKIVVTQGDWPS